MSDVSIVIPAYNESNFIEVTLVRMMDAMSQTRLTHEILVVDNGSTDSTASLVAGFGNVKVLRLEKRGSISAARNAGAQLAQGDLLAFVDADVIVTPIWSRHLQARCADLVSGCNIITGAQYRISEDPGWIERYWFKAMEERRPNYINGGNLIVCKSLFGRIGGFDPEMVTSEDVELCRRAARLGVEVNPDPEFVVHHEGYPKGLLNFFKRELWAGRGDFSSLSAFLESKTASTAVIAVSLLVICVVSSLLGHWYVSSASALIVLLISMASVQYKYGFHSLGRFLANSAIMIVHLVARGLAFVKFEKKA